MICAWQVDGRTWGTATWIFFGMILPLTYRYESISYCFLEGRKWNTYRLVNNDTNSALIHIEDNTSSAVVVLEWHTLVDRGINLNINIVSSLIEHQIKALSVTQSWSIVHSKYHLVVSQEDSGVWRTTCLISLLEQGSCSSAVTKAVGHFIESINNEIVIKVLVIAWMVSHSSTTQHKSPKTRFSEIP